MVYTDTYASDPITANYAAVPSTRMTGLNGEAFTYDATNSRLQHNWVSNTTQGVVAESYFTRTSNVVMEWDMAITSDPGNRKHFGAFIQTADTNVYTGLRVVYLDTSWQIATFSGGTGTGRTATVVNNITPVLGTTYHCRIEMDFPTGVGRLLVDGTVVMTWTNTNLGTGAMGRPGFFSYGTTAWFDNVAFNPPAVLPVAPTHVAVTPLQTGAVFTFDDMTDAASYEYTLDGGTTTAPVPGPFPFNYNILSGLTTDTGYSIQVRSLNSNGTGPWSVPVQFKTRTTYLYDDFRRANSTTTAGSPVVGGPYTVAGGTFGITSQMLYNPGGNVENQLTFPASADVDIRYVLGAVGSNTGFLFRFTDASNTWLVQAFGTITQVYRRQGGTWYQHRSLTSVPWATGDTARVVTFGQVFYIYRNGSLLTTYEDDFYSGTVPTVAGVRMSSDTSQRLRALIAYAVDPTEFAEKPGNVSPDQRIATVEGAANMTPDTLYPAGAETVFVYKGRDTRADDAGSVA